ncbi:FadR/GntR family transcriptional regulator [Clostridium sp. UBA1056]|uniref:FadR/GntR family transcriptional regulator n=1 Tax=unclassified Clostridium TaxID=2614128 RepID=UPI0032180D8C
METENKAYLKVIQHIKKLLLNEQLSLGDKLPTERELSEILSLSRNSIREAIKIMENMGIIESRHGSGNYLVGNIGKSFTDSLSMMVLMKRVDYLEISQLRRGIEIQALSLAMNIITEDDLSSLNLLVNKMYVCNEIQQATLDKEFHYTIVALCKNDLMLSIMQSLSEICEQFIEYVLNGTLKNEKNPFIKLHKKILESLVQKDLSMGIEAINEHYDIIDESLINEKNSGN